MENIDCEILEFLESKIKETRGSEQQEWVDKYDMFTSRPIFVSNNNLEKLEEVDTIRKEILKLLR